MQQEVKKIRILAYRPAKGQGGFAYALMAKEALAQYFPVEMVVLSRKSVFLLPLLLLKMLFFTRKKDASILVTDFDSSLFRSPSKRIAIVHHVDSSQTTLLSKAFQYLFAKRIFEVIKEADRLVVVASYWKDFFERQGFGNVVAIPNAFDLSDFLITQEEKEEFKAKHGLIGKNIVYLGNARREKGVFEAAELLRGMDVHLVTSGEEDLSIPGTRHLRLGYREYLVLLAISDVVLAMSTFREGWSRTAHEAMLLKTPVIGSGAGGMKELLEGGGQIVSDFRHLKENVETLLQDSGRRAAMGERGYEFTKEFTEARFRQQWKSLIESLL